MLHFVLRSHNSQYELPNRLPKQIQQKIKQLNNYSKLLYYKTL